MKKVLYFKTDFIVPCHRNILGILPNSLQMPMLIAFKKLTGVILLYSLFCSNVFGQDSLTYKAHHSIALQSGYSRHIVKDDVISPLVYSGTQLPILLTWQITAKQSQQTLSIYYDYLKLTSTITIKTPAEAFYSKNHNAFIEYSYNRKIYTINQWKTTVFAGSELKFLLNQRDHYYSNYTHYNNGELIGSIELSFLIMKKFANPLNHLSFRYNMSVFAYDALNYLYNANVPKELNSEASKNTSLDLMKSNKLKTINKYFEFQTELSYVKFINKFIGMELKHYFQYYNIEKFNNLLYTRYVNNQFLVGVIVKI